LAERNYERARGSNTSARRLATQRSVLKTIRGLDCNQLCYRDFAIRSRLVELEAVGLAEIESFTMGIINQMWEWLADTGYSLVAAPFLLVVATAGAP
jgi:hypothetical protein